MIIKKFDEHISRATGVGNVCVLGLECFVRFSSVFGPTHTTNSAIQTLQLNRLAELNRAFAEIAAVAVTVTLSESYNAAIAEL